MRVLILSQYFWPETFRINALVTALASGGADVTVLTGQPNYPDGVVFAGYRGASIHRERYGVVDVFRVPIIPRGRASALRLAANYLSFVVSASLLGPWLLRGRRVDVIFVYAPSPIVQAIPGIVLKHVKRAKLVTWVQDLWPDSLESTGFVQNRYLLKVAERMVRWIYRGNDVLLGQSQSFVAAIQPLAERTPVEYFPNPGELAPTAPADGDTLPLALPSGFNVVFTGNLGTVQALNTVLDAATILRNEHDVRFVLVGSGSRTAWLADEIARRQLTNVILAGRVAPDAVPAILEQGAALLVSLKKDPILTQTVPAKVQTYLSAGRPILASLDGEGAQLVLAAGAGFVSPAEDARALSDNVMRLRALSPGERARMGASGKNFYDRHFQVDALAAQLYERLRELVGEEAAPRDRPSPT